MKHPVTIATDRRKVLHAGGSHDAQFQLLKRCAMMSLDELLAKCAIPSHEAEATYLTAELRVVLEPAPLCESDDGSIALQPQVAAEHRIALLKATVLWLGPKQLQAIEDLISFFG
jgi:hypothetical protein